jgi:glycosyltransferase involved in cell wall biosynthesis
VWPALAGAAAQPGAGTTPEAARASVITTGRLDAAAVFEHFVSADLHVNPSLCESLNMATVEAAAVGTPTVCSDGAGIADWVRRHDAGVIVPRGEVAQLANAIIAALLSPEIRRKWSESSVRLAAEFDPQLIARHLIGCLAPSRNIAPPHTPEIGHAPP